MHRETLSTIRRAGSVSLTLTRALAILFLSKAHRGNIRKKAIVVRETIEHLGSVYIKFAQLLALRPDIIQKEYCHEMMYLLDRAPKIPIHEIKRIFRDETGRSVQDVFLSFEDKPLASASVSQVHKAILSDGRVVAVKIQRPNLIENQRRDMRILRILAVIYDILSLGKLRVGRMVKEVGSWSEEETDFRNEARSIAVFLKNIHGDPYAIRAPKIYTTLSSAKVFTMEFIEGFGLSRYLQAMRENDKEFMSMAHECGFEPKDTVIKVFRECAKYMFLKGVYHADLHPGNILYCPKNKQLYYIDFGIVGVMDHKMGMQCMRYMRSAMYHEHEDAFDALTKMLDLSHVRKLSKLRKRHDQILAEIFDDELERAGADKSQLFGLWISKTIGLLYRYRVEIPLPLLKYFRALSVIESTIFEVCPEIDLHELARKVRNVSIVHFLNNFSEMMKDGDLDGLMLKGLNAIEEYM